MACNLERTGVPLTVYSGASKKSYRGAPEQAARTFLKENFQLFGMRADLSDLKLDRVDNRDEITHVRFQQTYKGIPVWEGDYLIHLRPDGRVEMANGNYYPSIVAPTSSGISEVAARQIALDDLGGKISLRGEIDTELVVYPNDPKNQFLLVWKVLVPANAPVGGDWQFFVDATDGTIVEKVNLITSVTGDGDIIEDHPGLTPQPRKPKFPFPGRFGLLAG